MLELRSCLPGGGVIEGEALLEADLVLEGARRHFSISNAEGGGYGGGAGIKSLLLEAACACALCGQSIPQR